MLTHRRQQQTICDLIYGQATPLHRHQLDSDYQLLWDEVKDCHHHNLDVADIQQELLRFKQTDQGERLERSIDLILTLTPGQRRTYRPLSERGPELPELDWLWPGWIPKGLLTLLAAAPGVGKSYFLLEFARRVIEGHSAPDGSPMDLNRHNVVFVDAEGFLPILYQRGKRWEMDLSRFFQLERPVRSIMDLSEPEYQDELMDMIHDLRPDVVFVDSLSRVNRRGENNIEKVVDVIDFLVQVADHFHIGLILTHHLRKRSGTLAGTPVALDDIRGTGDLGAAARSVLGMFPFQTDQKGDPNGPRCLEQLKSNLGPIPKPLSIKFKPIAHDPDYAELFFQQADALEAELNQSKTEQAGEWLLDKLTEAPQSFSELRDLIQEELNLNQAALQRARRHLGEQVIDTLGPRVTGNLWAINRGDEPDNITLVAQDIEEKVSK